MATTTGTAAVEAYIAALPRAAHERLAELRRVILDAAPGATEAITYRMPTVKVGGRSLVAYAAFAEHYSLFPMSKAVIASLGDDAAAYVAGKGTLRFALDQPVPADIVRRVVTGRLAELGVSRPPTAPPYSYGSRDVQPGYESQGYAAAEPWGKDPWADAD